VTRSHVAAALVIVVAAACSPDGVLSPPEGGPASPSEGLHLLGRLVTGPQRGFVPTTHPATGLMVCLGHEPVGRVPQHLRNDAVVGCDRQFGNGEITPIDYTPENAPEFAEFVQSILEGRDDLLMSWLELAIEGRGQERRRAAGSGEWASVILMGMPQAREDRPPRRVDLRGHTLELMRLTGSVRLAPAPEGYVYAYDLVWEFYGTAGGSRESSQSAALEAAIVDTSRRAAPSPAQQRAIMNQRLAILNDQLRLVQRKLAEPRASETSDPTVMLQLLRQLAAVRRWTQNEVDSLEQVVAAGGS
jgi:hypothetical protein